MSDPFEYPVKEIEGTAFGEWLKQIEKDARAIREGTPEEQARVWKKLYKELDWFHEELRWRNDLEIAIACVNLEILDEASKCKSLEEVLRLAEWGRCEVAKMRKGFAEGLAAHMAEWEKARHVQHQ